MRKAAVFIYFCVVLGASSALAQAPQGQGAPPAAESPAPAPAEGSAAPAAGYPPAQQVPLAAPPPGYPVPMGAPTYVGAGVSEEMYRRNRNIAIVGKVLTALAPVLFMAAVGSIIGDDYDGYTDSGAFVALAASSFVVGTAGRVTWAAADLKMTNRFRESGVRIPRGAAIASTVAASLSWIPYVSFVATPATWISGAVASARIREAHDQTRPQTATLMPYSLPASRGFSTGFTLKF